MRNGLVPLVLLMLVFSQIDGYGQTAKRGAEDGAKSKSGGSAKKDVLGKGRLPAYLQTNAQIQHEKDGGIRVVDRDFIGTKEGTFLRRNFTFEVVVELKEGDHITFVGVGEGLPLDSNREPTKSVYLRMHAPNLSDGDIVLSRSTGDSIRGLGKISKAGTHRVSILKDGDAVTFSIDVDNDGPSDDDLELTIPDIKEHAKTLNEKNTYLFFGGSGTFKSVSLTKSK